MSEDTRSYGLMAILKDPVTNADKREELSEKRYDDGLLTQLNYEGTLVYIDLNMNSDRRDIYGLRFGFMNVPYDKFYQEVQALGLDIWWWSIRPYDCIWYNGVDSDMAMITLAEFLKQTNQEIPS